MKPQIFSNVETVNKAIELVKSIGAVELKESHETDKFGKLQVSLADCKKRDEIVFQTFKQHAIPVTVALGGGYSPDIKVIVEAHCNTFRLAVELFE